MFLVCVHQLRTPVGIEYSKSTIQNRKYVPQKGDIIIFKSNGDSHVGIVDYTSGSRIYYIDGNIPATVTEIKPVFIIQIEPLITKVLPALLFQTIKIRILLVILIMMYLLL